MRIVIELAEYIIVVVDGKVTANAPKEELKGNLLSNDFFRLGIAL
jgi:ABC-type multidrug transport system ATPase subunit